MLPAICSSLKNDSLEHSLMLSSDVVEVILFGFIRLQNSLYCVPFPVNGIHQNCNKYHYLVNLVDNTRPASHPIISASHIGHKWTPLSVPTWDKIKCMQIVRNNHGNWFTIPYVLLMNIRRYGKLIQLKNEFQVYYCNYFILMQKTVLLLLMPSVIKKTLDIVAL